MADQLWCNGLTWQMSNNSHGLDPGWLQPSASRLASLNRSLSLITLLFRVETILLLRQGLFPGAVRTHRSGWTQQEPRVVQETQASTTWGILWWYVQPFTYGFLLYPTPSLMSSPSFSAEGLICMSLLQHSYELRSAKFDPNLFVCGVALLWQSRLEQKSCIPLVPSASESLSEILNCKPKQPVFPGRGHSNPRDPHKGERN